MSTDHSPLPRLRKWSFFLFLFLLIGSFSTASTGFAACEYLSNDFSSADGLTASQSTGHWTVATSGMLDVEGISEDYLTHAGTGFYPGGYFSVDVDVSILATADQYDAVGLYVRNSPPADAMDLLLFSIEGEDGVDYGTDGIAVLYYPVRGEVKFMIPDVVNGAYVLGQPFHAVSGPVSSIGISMVADGAVIRVNRQDTNFKVNADFSVLGPELINTLRLVAKGSGLHARFDNVCASPYEVSDFQPGNAMPMPTGQEIMTSTPAVSPVISIVPASANPFGFGSVASGGSTLSLTAGLSGLTAPVDLYVGIGVGPLIYLFASDNSLHPLTAGLVKWRANTTGGINDRILPDLDMSGIPGTFDFYFIMAPAGRLDVFRLWVTQLVIGGGSPPVITDTAMEAEVKQNLDLIFGLTSGFSGGLTEIMSIFKDERVVNISPALDSVFASVMSGAPIPTITVTANFDSGYTMQSGSVMGGSAQIVVSNIKLSSQVTGADFSGTFNNVTKGNKPFANGQLSGNILMTKVADDTFNASGQININNLSVSGQQMSGTIQISGTMGTLNLTALTSLDLAKLLETKGTIRLTFSNFTSGAYTITGGYIDIVSAGNGSATVSTNLQTATGPVILNMLLSMTTTSVIINTAAPGVAGPYTLSMNNVTLNQDACANYPTGGTISFTRTSTGTTGVVTFTGACDGSYRYSE